MARLPESEFEVMQVLWSTTAPLTSRTVLDALEEKRHWKIQTVSTLLSRLVAKGYLSTSKVRREVHYHPIVEREQYLKIEAEDFRTRNRDYTLRGLVAAFAENEGFSSSQLDELQSWLDSQRQ